MAVNVMDRQRSDAGTAEAEVGARVVTAIDVGTAKVCAIVGRVSAAGRVDVMAHSSVPCDGLRKGNVYDVSATAQAVRVSIGNVRAATGLDIASAYVGITGSHVSFKNQREQLNSLGDSGVITADDLAKEHEPGAAPREAGRKLLHSLTMDYTLDGESGIRNPTGMHSRNVKVDTHVVTAGAPYVNKLTAAIEAAGITVDGLVLEPLASGIAILDSDEKNAGALVVDIGGGTTDVVGFRNGRIQYTGVIPVGGYQFTNDIAYTFNTAYSVAEEVKLEHANTEIPTGRGDRPITLPLLGADGEVDIRPMDVCRLTRERALELIRMVAMKVSESGMAGSSTTTIVLSGGASNLPGLADLMQRRLNMPVRQGMPGGKWTVPDELKHPSYSTGFGILLWGASQTKRPSVNGSSKHVVAPERRGLFSRMASGIKNMSRIGILAGRKGGN